MPSPRRNGTTIRLPLSASTLHEGPASYASAWRAVRTMTARPLPTSSTSSHASPGAGEAGSTMDIPGLHAAPAGPLREPARALHPPPPPTAAALVPHGRALVPSSSQRLPTTRAYARDVADPD